MSYRSRSHSFAHLASALLRLALTTILLGSALYAARASWAGHDGYFNPAIKRFTGIVTAIGAPGRSGHVVSFKLEPLGPGMVPPAPDSMVGWRLIMLNGKRWSKAFQVKSNANDQVTVEADGVTLDGIATKDVFLIEEFDPDRPSDQ